MRAFHFGHVFQMGFWGHCEGRVGPFLSLKSGFGKRPRSWSRDGRKVFFSDRRNLFEVEVVTRDGRLAPQPPRLLFEASDVNLEAMRSVTPDGRFLTIKAGEADRVSPVELVVNWDAAGN